MQCVDPVMFEFHKRFVGGGINWLYCMEWSGRLKCLCMNVVLRWCMHELLILTLSCVVVQPTYCLRHLVQVIR